MPRETKYEKLESEEHVLLRPNTYIGDPEMKLWKKELIVSKKSIIRKDIILSQGLEKIFIEILSNATDNVFKSREMDIKPKKIEITISDDKTTISIKNDGRTISLKDDGHDANMIFGEMFSGENFRDNEIKRGGQGMNGLGAKLTNIYSEFFIVEIGDKKHKKSYYRKYEKNKSISHDPIIAKYDGENFVKITFKPDFERFYKKSDDVDVSKLPRCFTDDMLALFKAHIHGAAYAIDLKFILNGEKIRYKSILDYAALHYDIAKTSYLHLEASDGEVLILDTPSKGSFVSFVNGAYVREGGLNVEAWYDIITKFIKEKLIAPGEKKDFTKRNIKAHISLIVRSNLENPEFRGQVKDKLLKPRPQVINDAKKMERIMKWSCIQSFKKDLEIKAQMAKVHNKKTKYVDTPKLTDAQKAGGNESQKCILILVEGDSAASSALKIISALDEKERPYYGILPLKGVVINAMNSDDDRLQKNKELLSLYSALGLNDGVDYSIKENFKKLRYGRLLLMTDADRDGIHIRGLEILFFHEKHPSLIGQNFLRALITPLIKLEYKKKMYYFYSKVEYHKWQEETGYKGEANYIKGLGRLESEDHKFIVKEFRSLIYVQDEETDDKIKLAFGKDYSNDRKDWLKGFRNDLVPFIPEKGNRKLKISKFIDNELIVYSEYANRRSIPSIYDGLKIGQRKILYTMFQYPKKQIAKGIKVAQLAGRTSELTDYEHGEDSLCKSIFRMAQGFPGSNNIPLIKNHGEAGTLLFGGKDMGKPRYVYVSKPHYIDYIFRVEDELILTYENEDGNTVEPTTYYPIIPLCLINGASGLGTGYRTEIPCYNPEDIIKWIEVRIKIERSSQKVGEVEEILEEINKELECKQEDKKVYKDSRLPKLIPWYQGYKGKIYKKGDKIISKGIYQQEKDGIHITALPVYVWVNKYKKYLNLLKEEGKIKGHKENHFLENDDCDVHFVVKGDLSKKDLKLKGTISLKDMILYDGENTLKKFSSPEEILEDFFILRAKKYKERKNAYIKILKRDIEEYTVRSNYIDDVVEERLIIRKRKTEELHKEMNDKKYPLDLLKMHMSSMTKEKVHKYRKDVEDAKAELERYEALDIYDIWLEELKELKEVLN